MINADKLEVLWLVIITCCVMISSINTWSARLDWKRWKDSPNVRHVFLMHAIYVSSMVILLAKFGIFCGAVWSCLHAPPPPLLEETQSLGNVMCMLVVSLILTVHASLSLKYRRQIGVGDYGSFGQREQNLENTRILSEIDSKASEIKHAVAEIEIEPPER